jgi:transposase-like protein
MIGGPGEIVEIDESKFGKRKFNAGHRVEGVWVVGGCEKNGRGVFAVPVESRNAITLLEIIQRYVHPGSVIYTDCWRGYRTTDLVALGYQHSTVNHTYNFVNPITQVHTNTIEGTWSAMKANIARRHRTTEYIGNELFSFIWKRKNEHQKWQRFLHVIGHIEYEDIDHDAPIPPDILDAIDQMQI